MADPVARTHAELEQWRLRERNLLEALQDLDEEEARLQTELDRVDRQVAYYESLARDMKKELGPPKLSTLLTSFARGR